MSSPPPFKLVYSEKPIPTGNHIDEIWFDLHPQRRLRAREILPGELEEVAPDVAAKTPRLRCVIVGLVKRGIRVRTPMSLPPGIEASDLQVFGDDELLGLLDTSARNNPVMQHLVHELRESSRATRPIKSRLLAAKSRRASRRN
jgi:hypothetical protein